MPEQQLLEFKPYVWMRNIGRSDLPKRCRDVLRMLAAELKPGTPYVQLSHQEMLDLLGAKNKDTLRKTLKMCVKKGWLDTISEPGRPLVYIARVPSEDSTQPPPETGTPPGNRVTPETGQPPLPETGQPPLPETGGGPPYYREKERESSPARARGYACEESDAKKLQALLRAPVKLGSGRIVSAYALSREQAGQLYDAIHEHLSDPYAYVKHRIEEGIRDRIKATTLLLEILPEDAERDALPEVVEIFADDELPAAAKEARAADVGQAEPKGDPPTDPYQHPAQWAEARQWLHEHTSSHNWSHWLQDLRAELGADGLVVYSHDPFAAEWVAAEFGRLVESAAAAAGITLHAIEHRSRP